MSIPVFILWLAIWVYPSTMVGFGTSVLTGSTILGCTAVVLFSILAAFCTLVVELFFRKNS